MQTWIHESYQQYVCVCLQPLNEDWMKKTWSLPNCVLKKWKKNKHSDLAFQIFFDIMMFHITKRNDPTPMLVTALTARRSANNIAGGLFLFVQLCAPNKKQRWKEPQGSNFRGKFQPSTFAVLWPFKHVFISWNHVTAPLALRMEMNTP